MATTGWLGEQTVHEWGGWGTRFTTNVYISGIRRYSDHVDVSGTIYLYCKSNGAYSVWYDWNITSWSMGNNLGQIKERTYTNNILNRSWGKNFTVRINCSNSATSATFNAGFSDSNMGGRDKYWTIYFDRYATAPSGIKSTSSYTEYSTITTSCSGINWGQGYSNRKLTCTASYTFNGKTENFTLGTWTDGATSKTVTKSDFNFPADLNVSIKWVASTNVGSTTSTSQVRVGQTYPAPNLSEVNIEGSSPSTYKLNASVTGINYGENYSKREAKLYFDYTLDGISYSTLLSSISDGSTSITVEYDATTEYEPWKFIPDDEKGTLRLVVDNGHRTSTKSSAQIYCQPQYEAYIVESIPDSEKEKSEIYTGKNIQIQNAPKDSPLADFKLYGDTFQQTYTGKNLAYAESSNVSNNGISATYNPSTYVITINGTATTTWSIPFKHFTEASLILPAGTYTLKQRGTLTNGKIGVNLRSSGTILTQKEVNSNTLEASFTISSDADDGYLFIGSMTAGQAVTGTITVQLEAGSTATSYEPYVGGTPSPNPDYPQQIQTVTGLQTVEIQGKNLFNKSTEEGGWLNNTGGISKPTSTSDKTSAFIHAMPNTSYTLSSPGYYLKIAQYDSSKTFIKIDSTGNNIQSNTITTEANTAYIRISYGNAQRQPNVMLELGSTATAFVPYSKQNYEINLGKNLYNPATTTNAGNNKQNIRNEIQVYSGETYTFNVTDSRPFAAVSLYDSTGNRTRYIGNSASTHKVTFTVASNEVKVALEFYASPNIDVLNYDYTGVQLERGSTATTYAPYFEPIELCKLGDYHDYIWKDGEDWKIHKATGKYIFTGEERSTWDDTIPRIYLSVGQLEDIGIRPVFPNSNTSIPSAIVSKFTTKSFEAFYTNGESNGFTMSKIGKNFNFGDKSWAQKSDGQADMNGAIVYYALATTTDTIITDQALIAQLEAILTASLKNSVNNITNIAISPNLSGDMEISYYTKWQDTFPADIYSNGKNGTGQFKQIRRIGTK